MKKNMGNVDRLVRLFLAVVFVSLNVSGVVSGAFGIVLYILAAIFVLTSVVSFCPIYTLFGLNTCPAEQK